MLYFSYDGGANQADKTMQASKQSDNYRPNKLLPRDRASEFILYYPPNKLLKAVTPATEVIQPPRGSPGLQFATRIARKTRWKWLDIGFNSCTIYL